MKCSPECVNIVAGRNVSQSIMEKYIFSYLFSCFFPKHHPTVARRIADVIFGLLSHNTELKEARQQKQPVKEDDFSNL